MSKPAAPLREHDHKPQPAAGSHLADEHGHTWRIHTSGYRIRQCAIALPCACTRQRSQPQPAVAIAEHQEPDFNANAPVFDMRTQKVVTPAALEEQYKGYEPSRKLRGDPPKMAEIANGIFVPTGNGKRKARK